MRHCSTPRCSTWTPGFSSLIELGATAKNSGSVWTVSYCLSAENSAHARPRSEFPGSWMGGAEADRHGMSGRNEGTVVTVLPELGHTRPWPGGLVNHEVNWERHKLLVAAGT